MTFLPLPNLRLPASARLVAGALLIFSVSATGVTPSLARDEAPSANATIVQRVRLHADLQSTAVDAGPAHGSPANASGVPHHSSPPGPASALGAPGSRSSSGETGAAGDRGADSPIAEPRAQTGPQSDAQQAARLDLLVGDAIVVNTKGMYRVSVGNAKAIQVVAIDRSQLLLIGETPGYSKVHVWEQAGMRSIDVLVTSSILARLEREASAARDRDSSLTVRREADRIIVHGPSLSSAERTRFAELSRKYPELSVLAHDSTAEATVVVDLFFVEVKTERVNQLGIRWSSGAQGPSASVSVDRFNPLSWTLGLASQFTSMLQFLQNDGDAVLLARPSLTSKVGGSARFVAGGELPIPVSSALGQGSVLFKEYGVRIEIAPTVATADILNIRLTAEISSINFEAQVKDIPGIAKRRTESEVQVRSGDTLVVAGLITDDVAKSFERVPGIGDVPGIGGLFRSRQFRDRNSELLLFVSPRLVKPSSIAAHSSGAPPGRAGSGSVAPHPGAITPLPAALR